MQCSFDYPFCPVSLYLNYICTLFTCTCTCTCVHVYVEMHWWFWYCPSDLSGRGGLNKGLYIIVPLLNIRVVCIDFCILMYNLLSQIELLELLLLFYKDYEMSIDKIIGKFNMFQVMHMYVHVPARLAIPSLWIAVTSLLLPKACATQINWLIFLKITLNPVTSPYMYMFVPLYTYLLYTCSRTFDLQKRENLSSTSLQWTLPHLQKWTGSL